MPTSTIYNVIISQEQKDAATMLVATRKGGFATVHNYVSGTSNKKCIKPKVSTVNFISRFSYKKYVQRCLAKLETIESIEGVDAELFQKAKDALHASYTKTLNDDKSDAHRQAHDKFYLKLSEGVKIHYKTEKVNGETKLVLDNGKPIADSIMVSVITLSETVIEQGEYLPTNSRPLTIAKNKITKMIQSEVGTFKTISLKPENFSHLTIDGDAILREDLQE